MEQLNSEFVSQDLASTSSTTQMQGQQVLDQLALEHQPSDHRHNNLVASGTGSSFVGSSDTQYPSDETDLDGIDMQVHRILLLLVSYSK